MSVLYIKDKDGNVVPIFTIQGPPGATGPQGPAGNTPVKGTDYFTEVDKAEMVNRVLSSLPTWTGGSY